MGLVIENLANELGLNNRAAILSYNGNRVNFTQSKMS